jgi:hypothetical protein
MLSAYSMRALLEQIEKEFLRIHDHSLALIDVLDADELYRAPDSSRNGGSCGEYLLRSAAAIEQMSGGLTTRLWDDPFEWTLPERLATPNDVREYFDEVLKALGSAFAFIKHDDELTRTLPAPERIRTLIEVLLSTVTISSHFLGRAYAIYPVVTGRRSPGFAAKP